MTLTEVRIGRRHRAHVGDVSALAESIDALGLLHPVVVDGQRRLIAGARRLAAVRLLGWRDVPVRVVQTLSDAAQALRAERDENIQRKAFLPSEIVSVTRALEPLERAEAKSRLKHGGRPKQGQKRSGTLPTHATGDTRDRLGRVVGVSGRTLEKARAVVEAAERDPARYAALVVEMDRSGNISGAFQALQRLNWQAEVEKIRLVSLPKRIDIRHCAMHRLLTPLRNVDAIITDPPYGREAVPSYGELARLAAQSLRPGGVLAVMCGQSYIPEILAAMTPHLPYRWMMSFLTPSRHCRLHARRVYTRWKPVLIFGNPHGWVRGDVVASEDSGRKRHRWEQSEGGMTQLIEMLTEPGWVVCDPFVGSGTTAVACVKTGRRFIGCDIDRAAVRMTRARLSLLLRDQGESGERAQKAS